MVYVDQEFRKNIAGIACVWPIWNISWKYLKVGSDSTTASLDHLKAFSISLGPGLGELED